MTTLTKINGREIRGWVFTQPDLAWSFADGATPPQRVMLGDVIDDQPRWWVVTPADANRLERAGYEYAPR